MSEIKVTSVINKNCFDYSKLRMNKIIIQKEIINNNTISGLGGQVKTTKYSKTHLLGKGGFAKCYKIENLETK